MGRAIRRLKRDVDGLVQWFSDTVRDPLGGAGAGAGHEPFIGEIESVAADWKWAQVKPLLTHPDTPAGSWAYDTSICVSMLRNQFVAVGALVRCEWMSFPGDSSGLGRRAGWVGTVILPVWDTDEFYAEPDPGSLGTPVTPDTPSFTDPIAVCEAILTVEAEGASPTIQVSPADLDGNGNGTPPFTRRYRMGTVVTLTAPTSGFAYWIVGGFEQSVEQNVVKIAMTQDITARAIYQ